jgi:hypothetical protein
MTRSRLRVLATLAASVLVPACGLLVGIDPDLDVKAGVDAATIVPDSSTDSFRSPEVDANPALPPPRRPPEGTYVYDVVYGYDKLSGPIPFPTYGYGPTVTVTVTYIGTSCFEQRFDLRTDYHETMRLCVVDRVIQQDQGTRYQRFRNAIADVSASTTVRCKPGDVYLSSPLPTQPLIHDCTGMNSDSEPKSGASTFRTFGKYTYVGDAPLPIMGSTVVANHFHDDRTVSLSQTGSNVADWYFSVVDGTLQQLIRDVSIDFDSPVGKYHYSEREKLTLRSKPGPSDGGADADSE